MKRKQNKTDDVEFGDPKLCAKGGIRVGGFYVYPEDDDVTYIGYCPLCGDDGSIYGGNRWYTQACCYGQHCSLMIERFVTEHVLAGESIDEVHAQLKSNATFARRDYVERISAILGDPRTAPAYKKYLSAEREK